MSSQPQGMHRNLLLRRMPETDYALLAPHLEPIRPNQGAPLFSADKPVDHVIFMSGGVVSLVAVSPEGHRVEAGMFGPEGFGPTSLAAGDDRSALEGTMQLPDEGYRIAVGAFREALNASATLTAFLLKFVHVQSIQTAFTALSNAVHPIDERLARWILMCDDRATTQELPLTHEFMSVMLAVRRPSVTTALHVLEGNGLIRAERGLITIRNRLALEEFAGDAYGKPETEYARLLGSFP
jgi:CRP-like cAMP-binding protein